MVYTVSVFGIFALEGFQLCLQVFQLVTKLLAITYLICLATGENCYSHCASKAYYGTVVEIIIVTFYHLNGHCILKKYYTVQ